MNDLASANLKTITPFNKKLTAIDAFLPECCSRENSAKRIIQKCKIVFMKNLSIENFFRISIDLEHIKANVLNEGQRKELNLMNKPTFSEDLAKNEKSVQHDIHQPVVINNLMAKNFNDLK